VSGDLIRRGDVELLHQLEQAGALTPTALVLDGPMTFDRYESLLVLLGRIHSASKWWVGDAIVVGQRLFDETYVQATEALNLSPDGQMKCLRVALAISPSARRPSLSWWHHRLVSPRWVGPEQRDRLLDLAERERLTTRELHAHVRALKAEGDSSGATETDAERLRELVGLTRDMLAAADRVAADGLGCVPLRLLDELQAAVGLADDSPVEGDV
jgi:hypothetical protein